MTQLNDYYTNQTSYVTHHLKSHAYVHHDLVFQRMSLLEGVLCLLRALCMYMCSFCVRKQQKGSTGRVAALLQATITGADESGRSVNREAINLRHTQVSNSCVPTAASDVDGTYRKNRPMNEHKVNLRWQTEV